MLDCEEMVDRVPLAGKRGQVLLRRREDEGDPHGRPSTTVGDLTKAIKAAHERAQEEM
ncbi:MAG: hypothetical protein OXE41_00285 [Gammaproteobacteria bacterium]|nr:hypothetical protein [Gammaproteobacteria bacterium]MCY4218686.1 hypothetical protein [Gammaproteobacteria bacterium]MCY4273830.1 hypothetical protein [Gammaproteobacteria bacterium]